MTETVVGRTIAIGAAAGAVAGFLSTVGLLVGAALFPSPVGQPPSLLKTIGGVLYLSLHTAPVGAVAGAVAGFLAGPLLAVLRPAVAARPATARVVAAAVCFGIAAGFAGLLAALGTALDWILLLAGGALVVAPVTGAWKGPYLLAVAAPQADTTRPPSD